MRSRSSEENSRRVSGSRNSPVLTRYSTSVFTSYQMAVPFGRTNLNLCLPSFVSMMGSSLLYARHAFFVAARVLSAAPDVRDRFAEKPLRCGGARREGRARKVGGRAGSGQRRLSSPSALRAGPGAPARGLRALGP